MDLTILAIIMGIIGSLVYYLDQTFIQKETVCMNSILKCFLFTSGIVFISSFFFEEDIKVLQEGGSSNQDMMIGNAPF